ncbi:MAG: TIGR00366 family protein [Negativicutes bacterium]|nr:TIGR00366 family protein [Negativicutes bacterium]
MSSEQAKSKGFVEKITSFAERFVPDSYVILLILSLITFALALAFTPSSPYKVVQSWGQGFWILLEFSMQMALIIVTGYALATTPLVNRILVSLCSLPRTTIQVYLYGVMLAAVADYLQWGFGLIFSALLTRELARQADLRGLKIHYKLLVAATYSSYMIWHVGLSGSVPLLVATPTHFMVKEMGVIPVAQTLFTSYTLTVLALVMVTLMFMYWKVFAIKEGGHIETMRDLHPEFLEQSLVIKDEKPVINTPSDWLTYTPYLSYFIGAFFVVYLYYHFIQMGKSLDINMVNFIFMMLIIFLHKTPANLMKAVKAASPACWGVLLQFPFYAGIFGMMKFTGLVEVFAQWIIASTTPTTFPAFVAILSNTLGYFIPSGGGKWAVEAPYVVQAGAALGVPHAKTVIAYAFGNDWVNLIQPFWALPFMAVVGVEFRDFVGYTFITWIVVGIVMLLGLTFVPF